MNLSEKQLSSFYRMSLKIPSHFILKVICPEPLKL